MTTRPRPTPKQLRFVEEYLIDLNASAAARRAGYSVRTADRIGPELLGKTCVSAAIAAGQKELSEKAGVRLETIITELKRIAFSDPRQVMSWGTDGVRLRDSKEIGAAAADAVAEVSETRTKDGGSMKVKLHDKVAALKLLGEHLGAFTQKMQVEVGGQVSIYLPSNGRNGNDGR